MEKGKRVKEHSYTRFITQQGEFSRVLEKGVEGVMWGLLTSQVPASLVFLQNCNTDIKLLLYIIPTLHMSHCLYFCLEESSVP